MPEVVMKDDHALTVSKESSLLVTWQNPSTRAYFLMGHLTQEPDGGFAFAYYPHVEKKPGFRSVPGFPDLSKKYHSRVLFPLFSSRLMSMKRSDRPEWLASLGLPENAGVFEILGRSLGLRVADTVELYPEPNVDLSSRTITAEVPVHGLRYQKAGLSLMDEGGVSVGDLLQIVPEPENTSDERALSVRTSEGVHLGYVPAPILDYLERTGMRTAGATASAIHVNPSNYDHHQRLIFRIVWSF